PAARKTPWGPTPDNINRCADPIAPADNTIRSAIRSMAPSGPTHSTPTAVPPVTRIRLARVLVSRVRLARSIAGLRYARPGPTRGPAVDVEWHRADARGQRFVTRGTVEILDPPVSGFPRRTYE